MFYANVVFSSGLVVGVLLIVLLSLSSCYPLAYFPDFSSCCAVCSLLLFSSFFFLFVHHHEQRVLFHIFSLIIVF